MDGPVLVIRMQTHDTTCFVCGEWADGMHGVPTFNGDLVSVDFPDELDWHGQHCCEGCFKRHESGELETFDHFYVHLAGMLDGGLGI